MNWMNNSWAQHRLYIHEITPVRRAVSMNMPTILPGAVSPALPQWASQWEILTGRVQGKVCVGSYQRLTLIFYFYRYMIIKPYGEGIEFSRHRLTGVRSYYDVASTIKFVTANEFFFPATWNLPILSYIVAGVKTKSLFHSLVHFFGNLTDNFPTHLYNVRAYWGNFMTWYLEQW